MTQITGRIDGEHKGFAYRKESNGVLSVWATTKDSYNLYKSLTGVNWYPHVAGYGWALEQMSITVSELIQQIDTTS